MAEEPAVDGIRQYDTLNLPANLVRKSNAPARAIEHQSAWYVGCDEQQRTRTSPSADRLQINLELVDRPRSFQAMMGGTRVERQAAARLDVVVEDDGALDLDRHPARDARARNADREAVRFDRLPL